MLDLEQRVLRLERQNQTLRRTRSSCARLSPAPYRSLLVIRRCPDEIVAHRLRVIETNGKNGGPQVPLHARSAST
jgi:hypothetical protein